MNTQISEFLRQLYLDSRELPLEAFKTSTMDKLQSILHFDSALWFTGSTVNQHPYPQNVYLYKQSDEMIINYQNHQTDDPLLQALVREPGISFNMLDVVSYEDWIKTDNYLNHCSKFDIENMISTLQMESHTSLYHAISFYRNKISVAFEDQDKNLKQLLVPHLVEAMKANLFIHTAQDIDKKNSDLPWVNAICDHLGGIIQADKQFSQLLSQVYSEWQGPILPFTLEEQNMGQTISQQGLLLNAQRRGDVIFIRLQGAIETPLDKLTPQEVNIAHLLLQGLTNKDMAKQLLLSPATIKNHLSNISQKLNVSRRSQINHCLAPYL